MSDLNFAGLRQAIEDETSIPEFHEVSRRARRHRRWRRLVNTARVLGILVIMTPGIVIGGVVISHIAHPTTTGRQAIGDEDGNGVGIGGTLSTQAPVSWDVVAVDGIDARHTYALVDVCQSIYCSLQLSQVNPNPGAVANPDYGLLRTTASDIISDPRIVVENASTVVVSGIIGSAARIYRTLSISPAAGSIASAVRPVQPIVQGPIRMVKGADGTATAPAAQPPVNGPVLASATAGWWVVGTTEAGQIAVSASHDEGRKWSLHPVGVWADPSPPDGTDDASLATQNGQDVFLLVRSNDKTTLLYSGDAGATWQARSTGRAWPDTGPFGLVVTASNAVVVWFTANGVTSYLTSTDLGLSFHAMSDSSALTGPIVATGGRYVTLGTSPVTSVNGAAWQAAYIPFVIQNG